ncbi:MAG: aspartate aminotransferase family protein [Acidobacteria bacterium]|nr:aspartate aminotransferase family protein [Acidobacteriota bacterium]
MKKSSKSKWSAAAVRKAEQRHLMNTYKRPPFVFVRGNGCMLTDDRGKKYLDFLGGIAVNALGHAHPRLVRVIRREAGRAIHQSNLFHNPFQGPLAEKLAAWSSMDRVFFTNSGTEAIEGALKLARIYARKHSADGKTPAWKILALENSFHGRTFGSVSITHTAKYREPFEPLVPGAEFVKFNDVADLEAKFDAAVCAIVMETIQGEGGIHAVSAEFYSRACELATRHNALLIADEIQCGLGRTGRYFAYQQFSKFPDVVVVAKPLAGGLPLGALLARENVAAAFTPGVHGTTFGGGPMICATALEFLKTVEEMKLLKNVRERGAELRAGLEELKNEFDFVKEVRGEGLMVGVELTIPGAPYVEEALRRGVILNCTHEFTLRLLPPFIVTSRQVQQFLATMRAVFARVPRATQEKAKSASPAQPKTLAATR